MCLWGIFQSGGSEDVMQLLEDWWSESMRGCAAPRSPGGAEPRRMALHHLASLEEFWSPDAALGGGQLHPTWEESWASLVECSGWLGWTTGMSIGGE